MKNKPFQFTDIDFLVFLNSGELQYTDITQTSMTNILSACWPSVFTVTYYLKDLEWMSLLLTFHQGGCFINIIAIFLAMPNIIILLLYNNGNSGKSKADNGVSRKGVNRGA
jgi:hypothetical protein